MITRLLTLLLLLTSLATAAPLRIGDVIITGNSTISNQSQFRAALGLGSAATSNATSFVASANGTATNLTLNGTTTFGNATQVLTALGINDASAGRVRYAISLLDGANNEPALTAGDTELYINGEDRKAYFRNDLGIQVSQTANGTTAWTSNATRDAFRGSLALGSLATQNGTFSGTHSGNSSGNNTGDQVISLSGEATGSGNGSFAVTLTNNSVISKVLTGFGASAGVVSAADSILTAIQKIVGNIASASGTVATGNLTAGNGTFSGSLTGGTLKAQSTYSGTINASALTGNRTLGLPDNSGTLISTGDTSRVNPIVFWTANGNLTLTHGTHGALQTATTTDAFGFTPKCGAWTSGTLASRGSMELSPSVLCGFLREHFIFLRAGSNSGNSYSKFGFFTQSGDVWDFSTPNRMYWAGTVPYILLSGNLTTADGDVITDGNGASAVAIVNTSRTDISLRWISGTKWFTSGATVSKNGLSTGLTITGWGYLPPSADADSIVVYDGYQNSGGNSTMCWWNNTSSSKCINVRIWK